MSRTTALSTAIMALCSTVVPDSNYINAYDDDKGRMSYPYLVYDFALLYSEYGKEVFEMEVNIYDRGTKPSVIDDLADDLEDILDGELHNGEFIEFIIYKGVKQNVPEDNKQIQRRRLTFEIHLHEKGEIE